MTVTNPSSQGSHEGNRMPIDDMHVACRQAMRSRLLHQAPHVAGRLLLCPDGDGFVPSSRAVKLAAIVI
jgi:hypothetical protein